MPETLTPDTLAASSWPVAGRLLDAITRRDFDALASCLTPDVRFRGLVPRGPIASDTAAETAARFRTWFGGEEEFEVVDASIGQIGTRLYLRWRIRMWPAADPGAERLVEQHVFTTGVERVAALDLLCSGFHSAHPDAAPTCALPLP